MGYHSSSGREISTPSILTKKYEVLALETVVTVFLRKKLLLLYQSYVKSKKETQMVVIHMDMRVEMEPTKLKQGMQLEKLKESTVTTMHLVSYVRLHMEQSLKEVSNQLLKALLLLLQPSIPNQNSMLSQSLLNQNQLQYNDQANQSARLLSDVLVHNLNNVLSNHVSQIFNPATFLQLLNNKHE